MNRRRFLLGSAFVTLGFLPLASAQNKASSPRKILFGANFDYPPYEFLNKSGAPDGYDLELARAVCEAMGCLAEFHFDAWSEVRKGLGEGRVDAVAGMLYSEERDKSFEFSVPHTVVHYSIYVRSGQSLIRTESDLRGKRVIVERESQMHDHLRSLGFSKEFVLADSEPDALRLLASGAQDCALAPNAYHRAEPFRSEFSKLETVGPPVFSRDLCFAVAEGNKKVLAILNEGLSLIKASGKYKQIVDRWFGVVGESDGLAIRGLLTSASWGVAPVLAVGTAIALWNWSLRRQVTSQTHALREQLKERVRAEEALSSRLAMENLISQTSTRLINARAEQLELAIREAMAQMASLLGADRASIQLFGIRGERFGADFTWYRPGIDHSLAQREHSLQNFPWLAAKLRSLQTVLANKLEAIEPEASAERAFLESVGIRSTVAVPMAVAEHLRGFLWLSSVTQECNWQDEDIGLVKTMGEVFMQALERHRVEQSLETESERLAVTLRAIGDAVIAVDVSDSVLLMNAVAESFSGISQERAVGKKLSSVLPLFDETTRESCVPCVSEILLNGQKSGPKDALLIGLDAVERSVSFSASPILDVTSKPVGVVVVVRDIGAERRAAIEIQRSQKLESIGLLAGGIAHDFNNILTAIIGNLALARFSIAGDSEVAQILTDAETATMRARGLTQQLLTFARGGAPVKKVQDLRELVKGAATFSLRGSNVTPRFEFEDSLPLSDVDAGQISQVIQNLVINAKQAMPSGGELVLRLSNCQQANMPGSLSSGNYILLEVIDRGIGIAPQAIAKIFDPYFTTKAEGTGLGLTASYSIACKHGGLIDVESRLGEGSTFRVYLPAVASRESEDSIAPGPVSTGNGTVLVMDDDEAILRIAVRMLEYAGFIAHAVHDGEEAISRYMQARLNGCPYDVVIMDLTVPGRMGGKECVEQLLRLEPKLKAIVSSGYSSDPVMSNYKAYGFRGVVAKPYQMSDLTKTIASLMSEDV